MRFTCCHGQCLDITPGHWKDYLMLHTENQLETKPVWHEVSASPE